MAHAGRRGATIVVRLASSGCTADLSAAYTPCASLHALSQGSGGTTPPAPGARIPSAWWNDTRSGVGCGPAPSHLCSGPASNVLGLRRFHSSPVSLDKDYYKILGVDKQATESDLKKAYYKLAKQYHPDTNKGDAKAAARFQEVGEAYDTLRDPQKRAMYDEVGSEGMKNGGPFGGGFGGFGGFGGGSRAYNFSQGGQVNPEELFNMFFGGGGMGQRGGGGFQWQQYEDPVARGKVGEDIFTRLRVSFTDAVKGSSQSVDLSPAGGPRSVNINIPAGIQSGQSVQMSGQGRPARNKDGKPGNLFIEFQVDSHPIFRRDGFDVHVERTVDFTDALLGATLRVPTIDGNIEVNLKPGTQHGDTLRIGGKGIKQTLAGYGDRRGDQLVHLTVLLPRSLSARQRELLEEFRKEEDFKKEKAA